MATLKELRDERIKKLKSLQELGLNPYPAHAQKDRDNLEVVENFNEFDGKELTLAGRIMSWREHGQIVFGDLQDFSGKIQLYIKEESLAPTSAEENVLGFSNLNLLDIGDFVEATGEITKTDAGEISVLVSKLRLLTKAVRPLPDKHEGLKDPETIFRRRYLDLVANSEHRELFKRKAKYWQASRDFLASKGFIEVETPILEHVTGGADAKPFTTHHDALDQDFYLRISTELYLKRLVGGGFEKVYTFGPNFRNEGLSDEHLQEYYQIEWYWAYADYKDNMELVKEMFRYTAKEVYGKTAFEKGDYKFDLADDWEEIDYSTVIKEKFDVDVFATPDNEIQKILEKNGVKLPGAINRSRLIDNLWKLIRKDIAGPAFLINHPKFISPLAKSIPGNEELTERFQVILAGSELGNGYSELNDPFDQLERFMEQENARKAGDDEAQMLDIDYVEMLEYSMPPTSGYGQSERIFWALENVTAREGTLFPQMRKKIDEVTKELYDLDEPAPTIASTKEAAVTTTAPANLAEVAETCEFTREAALELLEKHVRDDYQQLHSKMVAAGMEAYGKKFGEDADLWYITGLLHDLDYFEYPNQHPNEALKWFETWGFPKEMIHGVAAHAHKASGIEPESQMAAALIAIDELAGFMYAYSLMRPEGFEGMKAKSIKKKFKDKAFARKINREEINYGIEKFDVDFSEHVSFLIDVFQNLPELK